MNRNLVIFGLVIGFLVILFEAIVSYSFVKQLNMLTEERTRVITELICLEKYSSNLKDAESGQRGFLITGDESYLDDYYKALDFINSKEKVAELNELEKDADIGEKIKKIKYYASEKLKELKKTIEVRKSEGFESAKKIVQTNAGKSSMDKIHENLDSAIHEKQNHFVTQGEKIKSLFRSIYLVILGSNIIGFSLLAGCMYLLNQDISKRIKTEEELSKVSRLKDVILDSTKEAIITLDSKGIITLFNKGAEKIFGISQGSVIDSSLDQLLDTVDNKILVSRLAKKYDTPFRSPLDYLTYLGKNNSREDIPWSALKKSGEKIYLLVSLSALNDHEGKINGYLIEATDITERKLFEEELKIAHLKAEAANLAKSQFMANMSHDLRTPLTSILGFSEILQANKEGHLSQKELTFLGRIQENGQHLLTLINSILDLERIEDGKITVEKKPVNLNELITSITKQLESQFIYKNLKLILDIPLPLEPINTDQQKLSQILINIIGNALKFTQKGSIRIVVTKNEMTNIPKTIEIIDTGPGIDDKELTKIFDPFYQIKNSSIKKEGSGLGLAISQTLCDILDYTIIARSEVGRGTTFTILLSP